MINFGYFILLGLFPIMVDTQSTMGRTWPTTKWVWPSNSSQIVTQPQKERLMSENLGITYLLMSMESVSIKKVITRQG